MPRARVKTPTKEAVTDFVDEFITKHGYPPSRREIAKGFGVAPPTAQLAVEEAVKAGLLEIPTDGPPGRMRALRVLRPRGMKHAQPRSTQFGGGR